MNELIARREKLKGQHIGLALYLFNNTNTSNIIDMKHVRIRAEKDRKMWDDFPQIQDQLECEGSRVDSEACRAEFKEKNYQNIAKCVRLIG